MGEPVPATMRAEFMDWIVMLMVESRMMGAQMGAAVVIDGRLEEDRLRRALRLLADTEPVLGCRFVVDGVPSWRRVEDLDRKILVEAVPSVDPGSDAAAFVASGLDASTGPQVRATVLRGPDGDTLALKASHVAVDGGALKQLLYLLASYYRALGCEPGFAPPLDRRPRSLATIARTASMRERLLAVRFRRNFPHTDWTIPGLGGHGTPLYVADSIGPGVFEELVSWGKGRGATVHDLLLAAYYRALFAELRPAPGARTPVNMSADLRAWLPEDAVMALANLPATWAVSIDRVEGEAFPATLARVVERTRAWKEQDVGRTRAVESVLGDRLVRMLGFGTLRRHWARITRALEGTGYPSLTNLGVLDGAAIDFGGDAVVSDCYLFGPIGYPGGLITTASTFRGRLRVSIGVDACSTDVGLARRILGGTVGGLAAAAGSG